MNNDADIVAHHNDNITYNKQKSMRITRSMKNKIVKKGKGSTK